MKATAIAIIAALLVATAPLSADKSVVEKHRRKFEAPLSAADTVALLRAVASELNAAGVDGGPFGLLRKTGGHNCQAFACDIICAGQGETQRQFDVLVDSDGEALATWNGPLPIIRIDVCEVVVPPPPPKPAPPPPAPTPTPTSTPSIGHVEGHLELLHADIKRVEEKADAIKVSLEEHRDEARKARSAAMSVFKSWKTWAVAAASTIAGALMRGKGKPTTP